MPFYGSISPRASKGICQADASHPNKRL